YLSTSIILILSYTIKHLLFPYTTLFRSGIINIETTAKNGKVAAASPVDNDDQIMLVTDGGQVIRCPVDDIRIAGRNTQGVIIFKDRKSTRLNSSHVKSSYAVFCLQKKKK